MTFSVADGPVETNLNVKPSCGIGTKDCPRGLCHMTKMALMPIYDKKSENLLHRTGWQNLVCTTGGSGPINIDQMMTLD